MTPTIWAGMIARNEERDIAGAIESIRDAVDGIVLIDTGSDDRTIEVAMAAAGNKPFIVETFTEASEYLDGRWRLLDFSRARNRYVDIIDKTPATHLFWLDADERLRHPQAIRRATYYDAAEVFGVWMQDGSLRWPRQCMWRTRRGIRFEGACHEYPVLGNARWFQLDECTVTHDGAPGAGQEDSNQRNLRILLAEWEREETTRTAFYIASTYRDRGDPEAAILWYDRRLRMAEGFRDEWLFAALYKGRAELDLGRFEAAETTASMALTTEPSWAEFHMLRAMIAYKQGRYAEAIAHASKAPTVIPVTHLFREPSMYRDQPPRIISWCHEHMGDMPSALLFAERAAQLIEGDDPEWDARIARLRSLQRSLSPKMDAIALCRPGAIGDVLMTLNIIPSLRAQNPGRKIFYFTSPGLAGPDALGSLLHAAGVDTVMDSSQWERWAPRFTKAVSLIGYPLAAGYPERRMHWHLVQYFAAEAGVVVPGIVSLKVKRPARPACAPEGRYLTLQTRAGWSKYKEWAGWEDVAARLAERGVPIVRIDESEGRTLAESIALVANAKAHLGIDSFANHLTNYTWIDDDGIGRKVHAVITWGSTQWQASGYRHNANVSLALPCQPCFRENPAISSQPRGPCVNPPRDSYEDPTPPACTAGLSVDRVYAAARDLWRVGRS